MATDHQKAYDELERLASQKGVAVPTTLDRSHQAVYDRLAKLNGADFDRAYMKDMVTDALDPQGASGPGQADAGGGSGQEQPRRFAASEVTVGARPQDAGFFFSR